APIAPAADDPRMDAAARPAAAASRHGAPVVPVLPAAVRGAALGAADAGTGTLRPKTPAATSGLGAAGPAAPSAAGAGFGERAASGAGKHGAAVLGHHLLRHFFRAGRAAARAARLDRSRASPGQMAVSGRHPGLPDLSL